LLCVFQLLACPGISVWAEHNLQLAPRYLWSEHGVMHGLVLRGLIALIHDALCSTQAKRIWFLLQKVIELLQDADGEVVGVTLSVLSKMLLAKDMPIASPIALQLAEMLRPLFDNESSYMQLLSMHLFQGVMEFVAEAGKKLLKTHVHQSLLPLLCHLYNE
ncbi:hypothetical protein N301_14354, partial [Charadrius vociferus]